MVNNQATSPRAALIAYLESTGWVANATEGEVGRLWRKTDSPFAVPVPTVLKENGADWELIIDRLAYIEKTPAPLIEYRIKNPSLISEDTEIIRWGE